MVLANLYTITDDKRVLDKTLTLLYSVNATLITPTSVMTPFTAASYWRVLTTSISRILTDTIISLISQPIPEEQLSSHAEWMC